MPLTSGEFYSTRPVWSPDGKSIAFAAKRHGNLDVFIMPAAGGDIRRLTYHSADDRPYAFCNRSRLLLRPSGTGHYQKSVQTGRSWTLAGSSHAGTSIFMP